MKTKFVEIDFEFFDTSEQVLELVCCSFKTDEGGLEEFWLLNNSDNKKLLVKRLKELDRAGYVFLAHGVSAEASSFYTLGLNPTEFKWIDTFIEFRCISNHNHEIQYGKHLVDGKIKTLIPPKPKWEQTEEDKGPGGKITHSLGQAVFKFTRNIIDTKHKNHMRDIIISGDGGLIEDNKVDIQKYCSSDIEYLKPILVEMSKHYKKHLETKDLKSLKKDMLWRGHCMAHNAIMERNGYPIWFNALRNFTLQITDILNECAEDINSQFPERGFFVYNKAKGTYTKKQGPLREWIKSESGFADNWLKTKTGALSLKIDAFGSHFNYRHSYPRNNVGAQILRYLKLKQSLNGFSPSKGKSFWDSVGRDKRVRAYLNPYGSLSSRYQPGSTGFLFLKPAWMRSLCVPPKGKMIVGIDYKSEEFLISALFGKDKKMIEAYRSGDVYMAFAKDCGGVPQDATKATHPKERQAFKASVLGISYLMTKYGLSRDMTQKTGEEVTEDEAQEYINLFDETYSDHYEAVQDYLEDFSDRGYGRLEDGWILFGDNENFRSVANYPKQGMGGAILRRAVKMAHDRGLKVVAPLHDALYFEVDLQDWEAVRECLRVMKDAFVYYYKGTGMEKYAEYIMLDTECWSPELKEGSTTVDGYKVSLESIHKDDRAGEELDKFKKYFKKQDWMLL